MADKKPPAPVGTIEVRGKDHNVYLDVYHYFYVEVPLDDGEIKKVSSETYGGLREQLVSHTRKKSLKVSVPFAVVINGKICQGNATGFHQSNGKMLVAWATGKKDTYEGSYYQKTLRPLDDIDVELLEGLIKQKLVAEKALDDFLAKKTFDVRRAVKEALAAAEDEAKKKEETHAAKPVK